MNNDFTASLKLENFQLSLIGNKKMCKLIKRDVLDFISDEENNESTTLIEEDNKSSNDTLKIIAICLIDFGSIGIIVMLILLYKNRGQ